MKNNIKSLIIFCAILGLVLIYNNCAKQEERETVLDKVVHIEEELITEIPPAPRWCDKLDLEKKRVSVGDCELYVEEEGKGIPIVLLHGGPGSTHHGFHPEFSRAKKFARVIYYDQRGCGLSDYEPGEGYTVDQAVDDLENLRKALGYDKWVVLGWSYGGYLGQRYVMKYPGRVSGLILMTAATGLIGQVDGTRQYDYISDEEKQRMREIRKEVAELVKLKNLSQEKAMELIVYNNHINGDWKRQSYYKPTQEEFVQGAIYGWKHDQGFNAIMSRDMNKFDLTDAFKDCPIPTMIIESTWDLTWTPDKIDIIHKNHPDSQLEVFEKSGHAPFADEPEKFFKILKEFVQNLPEVKSDETTKWKEYLSTWAKDKEDLNLTSEMSPEEAASIEDFNQVRKDIMSGKKFEDGSTPLKAFLSILSSCHFQDVASWNKYSLPQPKDQQFKVNEDFLAQVGKSWGTVDIFRAPIPPEIPKHSEIWPLYIKYETAEQWQDTLIFVYWKDKWVFSGNIGQPIDWRYFIPMYKKQIKKVQDEQAQAE